MTNRQLQAEETKRKIFNATMTLLQTQDADDIKVMDIIEAADVSTGSFYNYYPSKKAVFAESYKLEDSYFENVVAPQLTQDSIGERLYFFFDQYAYYNSEVANIGRLRYALLNNNIYVDRTYEVGTLGVLRQTVQWGIERGEICSGEDMFSLCRFMIVSAHGLIDNWYTRQKGYDLRREMHSFVSKFLVVLNAGEPQIQAEDPSECSNI